MAELHFNSLAIQSVIWFAYLLIATNCKGCEISNDGISRIVDHNCSCSVNTTGTLRYRLHVLQICNGKEYVDVCKCKEEENDLGSQNNPAASCLHILENTDGEAQSGVYYLKSGNVIYKTYCMMEGSCGSVGWTMIMKIDGSKSTFHYTSPYWTNEATYNEDIGVVQGLIDQETKLQSYSYFPFTMLCLGMKANNESRWIGIKYTASSLYSILADNEYRKTEAGRETWKSLISGSSLQSYCNMEGFNVKDANNYGTMARIGIIGNNEDNCLTPESRLGFGTSGYQCDQDDSNTAGNEARCWSDNGDRTVKGFGYILAQTHVVNYTLGMAANPADSCQEIKSVKRNSPNGAYYLNLAGESTKVYCHMDTICGSSGWTMIMKLDGEKSTFKYSSQYWKTKNTYNIEAAFNGLDNQETKLTTYSEFPIKSLCLGMNTSGTLNWLKVPQDVPSLYSVISGNAYKNTSLGREAWKGLIPGSSLQRNCNQEGFNVGGKDTAIRIGILGNNENECKSPDSRLGFGGAGNRCRQDNSNSVGNEASCAGDNGDKSIKVFGYIFGQ